MSAPSLPIEQIKGPFIDALNRHQTIVLSAPPGAGKSTRLPLWLLKKNLLSGQKIYLLQPRRLAAKTVACFLAKQLGEPVGKTVGYRLKNESKVSKDTQLEVITEGIFTQIIQHDPEEPTCNICTCGCIDWQRRVTDLWPIKCYCIRKAGFSHYV